MIKVLVADDNIEQNVMLSNFLTKEEDIKVIPMTFNVVNTLKEYLSTRPDVLILKSKPSQMNECEILNALDEFEDERIKCNVIILADEITEILPPKINKVFKVINQASNFNAILHSIRQMHNYNKKLKPNYQEMCENIFLELGFNLYNLGTKLLIKTIVFLSENKNYVNNNMYEIYHKLSQSIGISAKQIKWNIDNAVNSMYRFTSKRKIHEVFYDYDGRKPTTKYLIWLTLNKINKQTFN